MTDFDPSLASLASLASPASASPLTLAARPGEMPGRQALNRRGLLRAGLVGAAGLPLMTSTGCATLWDLFGQLVKKPEIAIRDFKVTKTTLTGFSVNVVALLKNPNPFGFRLDGLNWLIKLAGGEAAKGRSPRGLALKARGTSTTELDIDFDIARTAVAIIELITQRKVRMDLEAVGQFSARDHKFNIPASYTQDLSMPSLPDLTVPTFRVVSAGLSGITFAVEPLVKNPNPFDIKVDRFDFDVKVAGRQFVRSRSIRNINVASNKTAKVPFQFSVDLVDLGLTVASLAQKPRFNWEVGSDLRSGPLALPFKQSGSVTL